MLLLLDSFKVKSLSSWHSKKARPIIAIPREVEAKLGPNTWRQPVDVRTYVSLGEAKHGKSSRMGGKARLTKSRLSSRKQDQ
jgi:hypothetical protein